MKTHIFHEGATATSKGKFLDVADLKTLLVSIKGAPTSFTLEFKFMNACGDLEVLKGMKPATWASGPSIGEGGY